MTPPTAAPLPLPPRAVRWRHRPARPPAWAAGVLILAGLLILGTGLFREYVARLGTPVRATIEHLAVVTDNDGTTYRIQFHYDLAGRTHPGKAQVSDRLRGLLYGSDGRAAADTVPARAVRLPGGRAVCLLEDGPLTWLMLAVGVGWFGVVAVLLHRWYVRPKREWRRARDGAAVVGRVTAVGPDGFRYEFHPAGATAALNATQAASGPGTPAVGDAVTVLYDPARPDHAVIHEYGNVEVIPPAV